MTTSREWPSHYTPEDIAWEQGGRVGPIPMVDASCVGCGKTIRDCSDGIALCIKCVRHLLKMPRMNRFIHDRFSAGEYTCGKQRVLKQ